MLPLPRIAIVEDDLDLRESLQDLLLLKGYEVWSVNSAESFYKQLIVDHFDVLILDIGLPQESGLDVIQHISKNKAYKIIVLSAQIETNIKVQALNFGADRYLLKPIDLDELIANITAVYRTNTSLTDHAHLSDKDVVNDELPNEWKVYAKDMKILLPNNIIVDLSYNEWVLLHCLVEHELSCHRDVVAKALDIAMFNNAYQRIDVLLSRLRKKIKSVDSDQVLPLSAVASNKLVFSGFLSVIK